MGLRPRAVLATLGALALAACSSPTGPPPDHIDPERVRTHLNAIAAARAEGVAVGTKGEEIVARYVADTFRAAHLKTTVQTIPYVRITTTNTTLKVYGEGWTRTPPFGTQYVSWTRKPSDKVSVDAPIVFVGYGIVAPEFKWDDYKTADVTGKIVVVLEDVPRNGDHDVFGVLGETYYARQMYKIEEAARHGAAGIFIIHGDTPEGRTWEGIRRSVDGEVFAVDEVRERAELIPEVEGWLTVGAASDLAAISGLDFVKLRQGARETNFKPVELKARAAIEIDSALKRMRSVNVIGVVEGQTPEYVIVSSRWNHANIPTLTGETLSTPNDRDGAATAVLLEAARALKLESPPRRNIAFVITTAHHDGLIGLSYYADHPLVPANQTIAQLYLDGASVYDESRKMRTIGTVFQGLVEVMRHVGSVQGRVFGTVKDAETLVYYRPSQEAFAAQGIPSLYLTTANETGLEKPQATTVRTFNAVGATRDANFIFNFATGLAASTNWPEFKRPGGVDAQIQ